ncbi:bifunctional riboflavin kinase/FMN adenylyltransferase RibF [Gottschalkia acidurici 9a]|uniref:Riboflavin biosynthesis protein n=1 Tax=Gottschalkia acidurici (strain ATCC 7906 / DSM 604 / BCRC 14475 / CIP 104303 / KCTC 5404 / NCIMB 10678 / 9a) TaxID=1128398 RepID=K0B1J5_GOTA9|nr:bifunctional riboflavin kinase/FAD synthetase [Gottschalkia acidurici]AFS78561.1 bifunctional riboflavin kinase/FMN adenylyltransferase RibF [Gottschalkia acidurici 9a]
MKIIADKNEKLSSKTAVALGNFDGIHLGHQKLIESMVSMAKDRKLSPSIFTFDDNFNQFKLGTINNFIMSKSQKENLLENLGIETLYMVNFDKNFMEMSPEEFIKTIIIEKLNANLVVIGFNFKFGYKAKGDKDTLIRMSEKYGFEVKIIPPVIRNDCIVSSTVIRNLIKEGKVQEANEMLGRPYCVRGTVITGKGRGKKLGFATANLKCEIDYIPPKHGVYRTNINYNGLTYKSITNVGSNPTFNDVGFSIETHIINFDKNIYNENIEIEFLEFIREEKKFKSIEDLVYQVKSDIHKVVSR